MVCECLVRLVSTAPDIDFGVLFPPTGCIILGSVSCSIHASPLDFITALAWRSIFFYPATEMVQTTGEYPVDW